MIEAHLFAPDHTIGHPTPCGHYVYLHRRNTDGFVFYVGKGKDRRAWDTNSRNIHWRRIVKKHGRKVEILDSKLSNDCALSLEMALVDLIGISSLANLTTGGGGTSGWHHSEEAKKKISAFNKGKKISEKAVAALIAFNKGRAFTDEQRSKMSIAKKGIPRGPLSLATRNKISRSHIGIRPSSETLLKMSASKIGKNAGKNNPSYDHTIRSFIHKDTREFIGTRAEFIEKFSLANECVSAVINGKQKTVKGWRKK